MSDKRCVVTGLGVVTPIGSQLDLFWENCLSGKSGVRRITTFDPSVYPTQIAGEVADFRADELFDSKEIRRSDTVQLYALHAARMAIEDAALELGRLDLNRCGCVIGSGIGGLRTLEKQHQILLEKGASKVSPFFIPMMISDMCAGAVALKYGFKGPNYATVSACSSSAHALGGALRMIARGDADLMVTGGAESAITPLSLAGFCSARALSTRNDEPEKASRPFDSKRDGFVMGEGAAVLILEELEHAQKRGARIYAEFIGFGQSCDAYHITAPSPDGEGAARAIHEAIRDAGISPHDIDYINSHGTSTELGDAAEVMAIKAVLGDHARKLAINSTKSMTGHLLGAAGAVECTVCCLSIANNVVHPTINLDNPDPQCDLDFVPGERREMEVSCAVSNSFGFGGHNVSLVFKRADH
jgi:3-oxoacyl-[acyl-carrier-protein] synthase II